MKKIVSILAVAAMAASMFAADVSAQLKQTTDLFNSGKNVLTTPTTPYDHNNTYLKFSGTNGDAGAAIYLWQKDGTAVDTANIALWCCPVEGFKVTLGRIETGSLNRGTFNWWHRSIRIEGQGLQFNFNAGPAAIEAITSVKNPLLNLNNEGYAMVGDFWLASTFNLGDAGNLQVFLDKGHDMNAYGVGGWEQSVLVIGASYDHMPWQTTGFYADVFANLDINKGAANVLDEIGSQLGGQYCGNGLALRLNAIVAYGHKYGAADATVDYGFCARAEYAIDAVKPYAQLDAHEMMDKKYGIEAGLDTNFGACAFNAAFKYNIDPAGNTYSIPLTFTLGF